MNDDLDISYYVDYLQGLKPERVIQQFATLLTQLDELDTEDYFGTEGWRRQFSIRIPSPE